MPPVPKSNVDPFLVDDIRADKKIAVIIIPGPTIMDFISSYDGALLISMPG